MAESQTSQSYEFGSFRLDVGNAQLLRAGQPVPLPPKTFEVLRLLVSRGGRLVEKDALMKEVWPDTFVEEANVSRHIWALRKALGEDGADEQFIETVPKRGYRFAANVRALAPISEVVIERRKETTVSIEQETVVEDTSTATPIASPITTSSSKRIWIAAGLIVATLAAIGVWVEVGRGGAPLTDRDSILLAEIENKTGDPVFDDTIRMAVAIGLEQSPFFQIVPDERLVETLRLTGRDRQAPMTRELAHDICQRDPIKVVVGGSIDTLGNHYVISLNAEECGSGRSLGREQAEADSKERVLATLGPAMTRLRHTLGESLASVQQFDTPIERATTSSLEALRAFSAGQSKRRVLGSPSEEVAIPFFARAIELDPDFALVYHYLARIYQNQNRDLEKARHYATEAFKRRDRVSDYERLIITGAYHYTVTADFEKAIEAFEVLRERYPRVADGPNDAGVVYAALGMLEKQIEAYEDGVRRNDHDAIHLTNLAIGYAGSNRYADARRVLDEAMARGRVPRGSPLLYELAFIEEDSTAMQREADAAQATGATRLIQNSQLGVLTFSGQFVKARDLARSRGAPTVAELRIAAEREALVGADGEARRLITAALAKDATWQGRADAAVTLALIGDRARAQQLMDELSAQFPDATVINRILLPTARAALELRDGSADAAIAHLQPVLVYDRARPQPAYVRGQAYLKQRNGEAAAGEFRKLLERRGRMRVNVAFPLAHLGLGRALAITGDTAGAKKSYQDFFTLWKEADQDLPVLIQARREFVVLSR